MAHPHQRNISIDISKIRPLSDKRSPPRICVLGIVPIDSPIIGQHHPQMLVRSTQYEPNYPFVEQLRFSSVSQSPLLPAISFRAPSRLRDALRSIMSSGAKEVDFILARAPGVLPWHLNHPEVAQFYTSYLAGVQGAVIVFPDSGGPWPRVYQDQRYLDDRKKNLRTTMSYFGPILSDNFQLGLMDMVIPEEKSTLPYLWSLPGSDVGVCTWTGSGYNLERHGWRSAAACVGGFIIHRHDLFSESIVGHYFPIGKGRQVVQNRSTLLGASSSKAIDPNFLERCISLQLHQNADVAQVLSDPISRNPIGEWSVSSVRTVKAIHQALRRAAEIFVFRPVKKVEAITFQTAIQMALTPFYNQGLLLGPGGTGEPEITAEALPDRDVPMLSANLVAQIQPWCRRISLKVMIRSGQQPIIEEV